MKRRAWRKAFMAAGSAVCLSFSLAGPMMAENMFVVNAEEVGQAGESEVETKTIENPIESAKNGIVKLYAYFTYTDDETGDEKRELAKESTGCIVSGVSGNKVIVTSYKGLVPTKKQKKKIYKEKGLEKISDVDVEYILYHYGGDIRISFDDSKASGDVYESKELCLFSLNNQLEEQTPLRLGTNDDLERGEEVNVIEFEEKSRNNKYDIEATVVHAGNVIDSHAIWNNNGDNRYISHDAEFTDFGGALIDADGYLVGMNSVQGDYENYSLSVEEIRNILDDHKIFYFSKDKDEAFATFSKTREELSKFLIEKKEETDQAVKEAEKLLEKSDYTSDTIKLYQMVIEEIKSESQQMDNPIIKAETMVSDEEYMDVLEKLELAEKEQIDQVNETYLLQKQSIQQYVERIKKKLKDEKKVLKKKVSKWFIAMIVLAVLDGIFIGLTVISVLKTRKLMKELLNVKGEGGNSGYSERWKNDEGNPVNKKKKKKRKSSQQIQEPYAEDEGAALRRNRKENGNSKYLEENYPTYYRDSYTSEFPGVSGMPASSMYSGGARRVTDGYVATSGRKSHSVQNTEFGNWPTGTRQTNLQEEFMRFQSQRYAAALIWYTQGKRKLISITKPNFIIGKDPESVDCVISGNNSISRAHITIRWENEYYYVYDMNSVNGTFINGRRIGTNGVRINSGDQLGLANERFEFVLRRKG